MSSITARRPSAAFIVAVVALSLALVGSAIAGTDAAKKPLTKSQVKKIAKKVSKKQATKVVNALAPGLSVNHAATADSATTAGNGAAGYGRFSQTGVAEEGTFNMNDLTVSIAFDYVYCEDQAFTAVTVTGGFGTVPAIITQTTALTNEDLTALGATMADIGCPPDSEWAYITIDDGGTPNPGPFSVIAH